MSDTNKLYKNDIKAGTYGIAHEGYPMLALLALSTIVFALIEWEFLAVIFLGLFFFTLHFFRDPERVTSTDDNIAISPADGKIIRIEDRVDPIDGETKTCISVFMNVFSVHVNRAPVSGVVKKIVYFPGLFLNAALDKASTDNERCAYQMIDEKNNPWTFVQISGLIARRIVCKVQENTLLDRGARFGMIRFGSRVDLYIPKDYTSSVKIGEQVYAGETVLAKLKD